MTAPAQPASFTIAQIIVESATFSHSGDPFTVAPSASSEAHTGQAAMEVNARQTADRASQIVRLRLFTPNEPPSEGVRYSFDVTIAALLTLTEPLPAEHEADFVVSATTILVPFAREMIASLTSRGRFGVTWLQPINVRSALAEARREGEQVPSVQGPNEPVVNRKLRRRAATE